MQNRYRHVADAAHTPPRANRLSAKLDMPSPGLAARLAASQSPVSWTEIGHDENLCHSDSRALVRTLRKRKGRRLRGN